MIKRVFLFTLLILFGLIGVSLSLLLLSQEGLRLSVQVADRFLPGQFTVDSVQGRLIDKFILDGFRYSDGPNFVSIDHIAFSWHPASLLQKELDINSLEVKGAYLIFPTENTNPPVAEEKFSLPSFTLSLSIKIKHAGVESFAVKTQEDTPATRVTSLIVENLAGEGSLIQIGKGEIASDLYRVGVYGQLHTGEVYSTSLNVDYSVKNSDLPALTGTGVLEGSLAEFTYEAHFLSPFIGTVNGTVHDPFGDLSWKGSILADQIILSHLNKEWPEVALTQLNTSGEGTLSSYSLQATTKAAYDSFHDIGIALNLTGDDTGLQVTGVKLRHEDTVMNGTGQLTWKDILTWRANFTGSHINPAIYDQRWPGSLNLETFISGQFNNGQIKAAIDLQQLGGELRGFPVIASGKIEMDGKDFAIDALSIQSSDSLLQASGKYADSLGIDFKLESSNLETLWPDISGSMEASGRIFGSRQQPEFQFDLSGDKIVLGETRIADVVVSGAGVLTAEGSVNASVTATDVSIAGTLLDTLAADISGTLQNHLLEGRINTSHVSTVFKLDGGYADKKWNGFIRDGAVQSDMVNNWQLQQPASMGLSATDAEIGKLCLAGVQSALVCVEGKYTDSGQWNVLADITALPVDLFRNMQTRYEEFGGVVSGTASVKGQGAEILGGGVDLSADNLSVNFDFAEDYSHEIVWQKNSLHAVFEGSSADVKINSMLQDGSSLTVEAVLNDFSLFPYSIEDARIQGSLHADIMDLQPLSAISYPDIEPSGIFKGDMEFSGKLLQPVFSGHARLEQGKMVLPAMGITVKDVEMKFDGKDNILRTEVTASSGSGTLHAEGDYALLAQDKGPVEIAVTGNNFELFNLPEARINVSPDLTMKISKQRGDLLGKILITEAYIYPENLGGTVSSSRDVVFVDDQAKKQEAVWPFYTNITLQAGENVQVKAWGLRGLIGGELQIIDQPEKIMIGEGSLNVREGTFSIYGRQLKIVRGRVLYSSSPLDNPGIDVRAENFASGVTTGIQVSGFLREPDISFYSTPAMEKDEIIRRLLMNTSLVGSTEDQGFLGSVASETGLDPFASAVQDVKERLRVDDVKIETGKKSDDLSLVIGTWMTPKLYISYGKNLLKESNNFNTRYVLGHGFSFETETGTTQSGFDFMYEINQ